MSANALYPALLAAQRQFGAVKKDAKNPAFRSNYATLQSILETIEGPLWDNGLLVVQQFQYDKIAHGGAAGEGTPILITRLVHAASGESIESVVAVSSKDPHDPQKVGSAITYYRRYSLLSLLGLTPEEDDDGHAASQPRHQYAPRQDTPQPQTTQQRPVGQPRNGTGHTPSAPQGGADQGLERATERQVKFIHGIAREAGLDEQELADWCQELYQQDVEHLNRRDASTLIEALQRRRNEVA